SGRSRAVAVFCGSSLGNQKAFEHAATSIGHALARTSRPLVYGGGSKGIMGVVSGATLDAGGSATGVVPEAMIIPSQSGKAISSEGQGEVKGVILNESAHENMEQIVVKSMHERKVEMARRVGAFVGLPGGYGTFEELMEVVTWTQIGIHSKPVVLVNVLGFYSSLRELVRTAVRSGFIKEENVDLLVFVDGPSDQSQHSTFDWGSATLEAIDAWSPPTGTGFGFKWS
ncbi:hypothetical protein SISNIDRAFT_392982, partial [Sistotremastrum niveocremeum HHB9708]